jgi:hypothetical protein
MIKSRLLCAKRAWATLLPSITAITAILDIRKKHFIRNLTFKPGGRVADAHPQIKT